MGCYPVGAVNSRNEFAQRIRKPMSLLELVTRARSYRQFYENEAVSLETLRQLVELVRLSSSGGNVQPLKFYLSRDPSQNAKIFPTLTFAGQLKDWSGPAEGERPAAYIVILGDKRLKPGFGFVDQAIAAHTILLGATEKGLGGVIIGAVKREQLSMVLDLPEHLEVLLVVPLGKPKSVIHLEPLPADGNTKYSLTENVHFHVPKRSLDELLTL